MTRIWDISQTLRPGLPVWPGDTPFGLEETWTISEDCPVKVSKLTLSTHSGAHADAPSHYDADGVDIASVDPSAYIGPCVLVTATGSGERVAAEEIDWSLAEGARRLLIRTYPDFPHSDWDSDFRAVSVELIDRLAAQNGVLIGVDSPSLDPETSKELPAHHAVRRHGLRILEGLVLDGVPDGRYELIAPPLKIAGADAAPVRALLRSLEK